MIFRSKTIPQYTPNPNGSGASSKPSGFALDVGKLGGMYAGKIFLVGTEQGLGVRNAGSISSTESILKLNANGDLINQGNIVAAKDQIELKAQNISNTGNISSTNNKIQLQATDISNAGLIASMDEVKLDAKGNINNNQGVINAGRIDLTAKNLSNEKGQIEQVGGSKLKLSANSLDNQQGRIGRAVADSSNGNSGSDNNTAPPTVKNPGQNSSAQDASKVEVVAPTDVQPKTFADGVIQVENQLNNQSGKISNNNDLTLMVRDKINNTGGELQLPELKFAGQEFENQGGKLSANQIDIQASKVNNQQGQLNAVQALDIRSQQLNNQAGSIQSQQALKIDSKNINNQEGKLLAVSNVELQTEQLNNQKGVIASTKQDVAIKADRLDNSAGQISGQQLSIESQQINDQSGMLQSQSKDLVLKATQIENGISKDTAGNIIAAKNLNIQSQQLKNTGQIYAGDSAQLHVSQLQQHGQLATQNQIKVQAEQIQSNADSVWAAGLSADGKLNNDAATLEITAQDVQIAGKLLAGAHASVKASNTADLSDSGAQAKKIQVETTALKTNRAKFIAEQQLNLKASQSIENEEGQYSATDIQLDTQKLNNNKGLIQHTGTGDFALNIADRIDNNAGKIISNAAHTEIKTKNLSSIDGAILHAGDQQLKITAQDLQGQQGKIQSNGNMQLELGSANLDRATTSVKSIELRADSLSHQKGQMLQTAEDGSLQLTVNKELNNREGEISAAGNSSIKAQSLNNQTGKILSNGQLDLSVTDLNNESGTIYADKKLNIEVKQGLNNQQGLIASQQALALKAQDLNNQKGQIQSGQASVNLNVAGSLNNQAGTIQSAQALQLNTAQLDNRAGKLIAGSDAVLNAAQLNNQSGTIYAKKQLDLHVAGTTDNSAGVIAAEQALNLTSNQLLNHAGQIRSENADLNLTINQDVENDTGLIAAAKNLNLTAQHVSSKQGKIQAGGSSKLQLKSLDNTEGVVYAAEQLELTATESLNNQKGTIAAEKQADLQAGTINNEAGQIRSQQDQLTLNVQNDLNNFSGEISAAKNLEIKAKNIQNQKGKVVAGQSLQVDAQQIDNTEGVLYAKAQQNLTISEQLNNQSGTVVANQQLQVNAGALNNNAGKIRSEQNQLDLHIQNRLDNQSGEIFAGSHAKINAAEFNNQQGVVYSKQDLGLDAVQLKNQQGQIFAEGQAQLNVKGSIDNHKGVLAAKQNLDIQTGALNNQEGTLRSENADLNVHAQGQLINQQGDIYAGQNLTLNSLGLDNSTGQIAAKNQLSINTQQQQLTNQQGKILAKTVDLTTGLVDNQAGLIQAEQSVKINTNQQALLNNNSGEQGGILSQGSIDLNVSTLENQKGYIASMDTQQITAQNIGNQAGQIISQTDLNIQQQQNGGAILNNAGTIQAQKNLNLSVDQVDNSGVGSQITAGEKLTIHANDVINSQTKDGKVAGGLNAKNLELHAQRLDNQSGMIRANDQAQLNIQAQLKNQAGTISSLNQLRIGTAEKGLNIDNTGGELLAKNQLDIQANELVNQGKIISEGNVEIDLKQDFTHTQDGKIGANGLLKLSTEKNIINRSELTAGQKIILNAQDIDNQKDATISANELHLLAQNTVHNQGLINGGDLTHIQANRVWNDGARIYGTHVAIQANTLDNQSNLAGTGAVIASRGDMDLGIGTLNNRSGGEVKDNGRDNAWIFSAGNLNIGGSLDSNLKAQGSADKIYNGSAVIESLGDMHLGAKNIQNVNENLVIELVEKSRERVIEYGKDGQMWNEKDIRLGKTKRGLSNAVLFVPVVEGGPATLEIGEDWTKYDYVKAHHEDVVKSTSPGQIIAGGNLSFAPDANFLNKDSQVLVGQSIKNGVGSITNESTQLRNIERVESGTSRWHTVKSKSGIKAKHKHAWGPDVQYRPADIIQTQDISLSEVKEHTLNTSMNPAENIKQQSIQQHVDQAQTGHQAQRDNQHSQNQQIDVKAGQVTSDLDVTIKKPDGLNALNVDSKAELEGGQQQNVDEVKSTQLDGVKKDASAIHQSDDVTVRTITQDHIRLPSNALLITTKDSQAQHLVETDPAFTNYKQWLSSDHMIKALGLDPALQQKRLGDGYYEQRLVQDQVAKLTGRRFLDGYGSDEDQYKALMNNGTSFAKQYKLKPGIALTPEQIAQLTSDIVWLEEKTIILADGSSTKALVPQVYVKARVGDLRGDGTLISADSIQLDVKDNVINSGTIAGRQAVVLNAENIDVLNGRIQANQVGLTTKKDLNIIGGQIHAQDKVDLNVGNNLNLSSSTQSSENKIGESVFTRTGIDRVAGIYTKAPSEIKTIDSENLKTSISVRVGGDATIKGAEIINENGSSLIKTQGNLNIGTIQTELNNHGYADADNYNFDKKQRDIGSVIKSQGDTRLQAENIQVKGSQISSEQGSSILSAQQQLDIVEGRNRSDVEQGYKIESKGVLSRSTEQGQLRIQSDEAIASTIDGKKVVLDAKNIKIQGSEVVSDELTQIQAKENIEIKGAENSYLNINNTQTKKSGLMSSGGLGVSIGSKKEKTEQEQTQHTNSGSMVGSLNGNTNIVAGKNYQQTGSTVSSQQGDVNILAQQVTIEAAKEKSTSQYKHEMEQKGLTLAVNVPVVSNVQTALESGKQVGQSKNDRVNAMAAANAGFDSYKAGQSLKQLADVASDLNNAGKVEVGVSLTYGQQKNTEFNRSESTTASQSTVSAGGKTNIVATGAGKDSNINIIGSDVMGLKGTHLAADQDVNIKAAEQNSKEESGNKSAGWNAGVTVSNQTGFGVTAGGNLGKGKGNGESTSYVNSHVGSKDSQTTISSGNATNIIGGQVQGKAVQIDAKELNIESLQDKATYKSKQQNISGQVSVGTNGGNASGSFSKSNINANHASVSEQSGIFAGDEGYQIKVKDNTDLKGAIITSTQLAETQNKNSLSTGTLTHSELRNVSEYDAKGISVGAGFNAGATNSKGDKQPDTVLSKPNKIDGHASSQVGVSKSIGFGLDSDKDSSVTKSGVNTKNITITNESGQQQLTGKTAEQIKSEILTDVTTDTARENSGALNNVFDKDKVQKEINLQMDVTKKFGENAPKAVADYASSQAMKLRAQGNEAEAKKWDEGGAYRIAMHTALGALGTGSLEGALTTGGVATAAPLINQFEDNVTNALIEKGMSSDTAKLVANGVSTLTLTGVGASTGLSTGSIGTAINVDSNNRQLHVDEAKILKQLKEGKTKAEQDRLNAAACALVQCSSGVPTSDPNYVKLKAFEEQGKSYTKEMTALKSTGLFEYGSWDKANDFRTRHDEGVSRVGGAGKIVTGGVTAVGGAAAGAGLCTSGVGCAIGAPLAGTSVVGGVGTAIDGKNQLFGDYNSQEGQKVIDSYNPNRKQELSQLSQDALGGAAAIAEAVLLGKVGGKLSQGVKSEVKTTEKVAEVDATKKKEPVTNEPEANFAGQVPIRPRDGHTPAGTSQVDTPLGKHLINGEVAGRKNQKVISGGHNSDNFYDVLNSNGGKVIGNPTQVSKGITDIKYQLPNGRIETKTVYDPKVYSDKQMAIMANEAASKAILNYGVNGNKIQHVIVNGITFRVPISSYKGTNYVPSAFPINPTSGAIK
ncbi:hemagglutinin repeat-containing protein [Acinetobacter colistiniresistens]|uniref:hemagglutinin repeat-containing protein n=1 Tax=Acinetobacter colistiniresistens TaxID=280145 RepID=UPI001D18EC24